MSQKVVIALHGFLGAPSDWSLFFAQMSKAGEITCEALNLISFKNQDLNHIGPALNQMIKSKYTNKDVHLVGYSMGGRLALHALEADPYFYKSVSLFSVNPGLKIAEEKTERLKKDKIWAERFANENLDHVLQAWNSQAVFAEAKPIAQKNETDPSDLSKMMLAWSLGNQKDFENFLVQKDHAPVLWMTGELDKKFSDLALQLKNKSPKNILFKSLQNGSHRFVFEEPRSAALEFLEFINSCSGK